MVAEKNPDDWQQIPTRLHRNDYKMLKKVLFDEGMTYQTLVQCLVHAYLDGNPQVLKIVKTYKEALSVPAHQREAKTLSQRERDLLLKEIEDRQKQVEPPKDERKEP